MGGVKLGRVVPNGKIGQARSTHIFFKATYLLAQPGRAKSSPAQIIYKEKEVKLL